MSTLSHHISFVRLVDLVDSRLAPDELAAARSHIATCLRCAAELAWLERVIGLMRTDTAEQPPAHVVAAAKRLFQPPAPALRPQLLAALQFDSARTPIAPGRRAGTAAQRQLLFAVSDYLLDVRLVLDGSQWAISGQLLGANDGRKIELDGPAGTVQAALNELNEFALPPLPAGIYTLKLQLFASDIVVDGLEVG
jgi:hypothetical protein